MIKHEFTIYNNYRECGVEWLGHIPSNWEVKRLKEISEINRRTLSDNTEPSYEFKYVDIGSVTYGVKGFATEQITFDSAPSRAKRVVKKGDTIISTVRTYLKAITSIDEDYSDLVVSTGFAVISPNKKIFNKFCSYLLTSDLIVNKICALSKGVSYPAINSSVIGDLFFLIPNYATQRAIANYLDIKTAQIDKEIELLAKKNTKYSNLKESLINEIVTGGLDKNVTVKDSGIEWIGMVPEHWEVKRVKELFDISRGRVIAQTELIDDGKYPVYSSQTKDNGCLGHIDTFDYDGEYITWTTDGVNAGTVFLRSGRFNCTNICGTLKLNKKRNYIGYLTYSLQVSTKHNKRIDTNGAKIMSNEMMFIKITIPPYAEQKAIADYLDDKITHIDYITETIKIQIEKLKELRKTLINDVVTGKIKVYKEGETI